MSTTNSSIVVSLEDFTTDYTAHINGCVEFTGLQDLRHIYREYLTFDSKYAVGIYQHDFKNNTVTACGQYGLLLQKAGNYQLMEDVVLESDNQSQLFVGIVMSGKSIHLDLRHNVCTVNIQKPTGYAFNIANYNCGDCTVRNGVLKSNNNAKIYLRNCVNCNYTDVNWVYPVEMDTANEFQDMTSLFWVCHEGYTLPVDDWMEHIVALITNKG
jgi:hypothetical protein